MGNMVHQWIRRICTLNWYINFNRFYCTSGSLAQNIFKDYYIKEKEGEWSERVIKFKGNGGADFKGENEKKTLMACPLV